MRRFQLIRDRDVSGVSGTGHVADGIALADGTAVVKWLGEWPTVTLHARGIASVEHIHCHGGATRIVWVDDDTGHPLRVPGEQYREQKTRMPEGPGEGMRVQPQAYRHQPTTTKAAGHLDDGQVGIALAGLRRPNAVLCQVYEDGGENWSDEPTDAERIDVQNVRKTRPGFRGIITLERGPS